MVVAFLRITQVLDTLETKSADLGQLPYTVQQVFHLKAFLYILEYEEAF